MLNYFKRLAERQRFGMRPGLETMRALLSYLGNPEQAMAVIHIAGTNGKGTVAALCESVLRAAGFPVARYTSPHLVSVSERFLINGQPVDDVTLEAVARDVEGAVCAIEAKLQTEVTYFECLTAVAFLLFKRAGVKLVVLETGLGGRLDATNVVMPLVSVITRVGLDHCQWLGDSVEKIAAEKAGIIKPNRPVICAEMPPAARAVIHAVAVKQQALCVDAPELVSLKVSKGNLTGQTLSITTQERSLPPVHFPLAGAFQVENVCTAVAALEMVVTCGLAIPDVAFVKGVESVCWPGRFQLAVKNPPVIVDGAHNPDGARALRLALKNCHVHEPIGLVTGFCGDKDALEFLRVLAPAVARAWGVAIANARSLTADQCAGILCMAGIDQVTACVSVKEALAQAQAWALETHGVVVVCGSLFLAGEALVELHAFPWAYEHWDANEALHPCN